MHDEDSVHPDDALLQQTFAATAEHIRDPAKKDIVLDFIMTARPLAEWSAEELNWLRDLSVEIVSWARMTRELEGLTGPDSADQPGDSATQDD